MNEEIPGWEVMGVTELRFLETTAHWGTVIHDCVDGCQGGCHISVFVIITLHSFRFFVILWSPLSFAVKFLSLLSSSNPLFLFISFLPLSHLAAFMC